MRFSSSIVVITTVVGSLTACEPTFQECAESQSVDLWTRCIGTWSDPAGGRVYAGEFQNGTFHGQGLLLREGAPAYSGEFRNGEMHGLGVLSFDNGQRYVGNMENGVMSGFGRLLEADGREIYSGPFAANAPARGAAAIAGPIPSPMPSAPVTLGALNPNGAPKFGVIQLATGFMPDPHRVRITGGGGDRNPLSEDGCVGYLQASAPTVRLDFQAGILQLTIGASGDDDFNLVVRLPDGRFVCDDDGGLDVNPRVVIERPASGAYLIWVGTWDARPQGTAGELTFSEIGMGS
jgi:hypothetical protein